MVKIDPRGLRFCKNVLPVDDEVLAGYRFLHMEEAMFTMRALEAMPSAVANWYGYLALFVDMLRGEYECLPDEDVDACNARMLKMHFASAACATSKLALDASLAGHYDQARGLIRHMLETWMQIAGIRLNSQLAKQWMGRSGGDPIYEPAFGTVVRSLKKNAKTEADKENIDRVERLIDELHKGAHPSRTLVAQIMGDDPGTTRLGGNLNIEMLRATMSRGTLATIFLIVETGVLVPFDEQHWSTFQRLAEERRAWHTPEDESQPSSSLSEPILNPPDPPT